MGDTITITLSLLAILLSLVVFRINRKPSQHTGTGLSDPHQVNVINHAQGNAHD